MNDKREPPKVNVGARIPADWAEEFKELATSLHCRKTELFTEALGLYLGKQIDTIVNRVTALEKKRDRVNDSVIVDTGINSELIKELIKEIDQLIDKKFHQFIESNQTLSKESAEIDQAPIKENTETNQTLIKENTELKNTIANLKNQITNLNHQINNIKQQPPIEKLIEPASDNKYLGGITQKDLCIRSSLNPGSLASKAKKAGMSPQEYLAKRTGWECRVPPGGKLGRWHPPSKPLPTEES